MTSAKLRVLLSWEPDWLHVPPIRLSKNQVTLCPNYGARPLDKAYADALSPIGIYDLYEFIADNELLGEGFDLICVYASGGGINLPFNTNKFNCPTVLLAGDTHHMSSPLTNLVSYASTENFTHVVAMYCKQHLHWFSAGGLANTAWLPLLSMSDLQPPKSLERRSQVAFVGQVAYHPKRYEILQAISNSGINLCAEQKPLKDAAQLYRSSVISLNCSLNGDLNLRVLEIIASCGFLLTDRLPKLSGIEEILVEGVHYRSYDSISDAIGIINHYLAFPKEAENIARTAYKLYIESLRPSLRVQDLIKWIKNGVIEPKFSGVSDFRHQESIMHSDLLFARLNVYEAIQELSRTYRQIFVRLDAELPPIISKDLDDLQNVTIYSRDEISSSSPVFSGQPQMLNNHSCEASDKQAISSFDSLTIFVARDLARCNSADADIVLSLDNSAEDDQATDALTAYSEKVVGIRGGSTTRLVLPCDFGTDYVLREVFEGYCYATPEFIQNVEVIVDFGANTGISAAFFRLSYKDSQVYCFEPDPRAFHFLKLNSVRLSNCHLSRIAVGNETKKTMLSASKQSSVLSSLDPEISTSTQSSVTMANALELLRASNINAVDIMKIDTEGCEMQILDALSSVLEIIRVIHIEYHSEDARRKIDNLLFETHTLWSGNLLCRHRGTLCYIRRDCIEGNEVINALSA